ncbi:hypothetical protein [Paracoccus aerius]|uniref:Helix-turn-helix domain-containing protein n=2 Tax=Paracoccus aerius TaxID=1915382 RepID=A0ABS1S4K0_9RHOB|nr:hypothetical protein [Paracoccus aerius]MBL3673643.1 hypothetical protein [Paracoccus aerius]GHG22398.1 hypothetical protein GCM10017322_19920 [Paracoccus aerius]
MGRDRRNEIRTEHFTKMVRNLMATPAWRELSPVAQSLYPWLKLEWGGPSANNNGKIRLSVRQAADCMGCSINTAAKAFRDLQGKGFIHVQEPARLGVGGEAKSPCYEITELAMPGQVSGRKQYLQWSSGNDFPVVKANHPGPCRKREKTEPRLKADDSAVIHFDMHPRRTSQK